MSRSGLALANGFAGLALFALGVTGIFCGLAADSGWFAWLAAAVGAVGASMSGLYFGAVLDPL